MKVEINFIQAFAKFFSKFTLYSSD